MLSWGLGVPIMVVVPGQFIASVDRDSIAAWFRLEPKEAGAAALIGR